MQLDIADDGDAAPGHGRGPKRSHVGYAASDCGKVRMRRGKEVEGDLRGQDLLR